MTGRRACVLAALALVAAAGLSIAQEDAAGEATVRILSPADGATIAGPVEVIAAASEGEAPALSVDGAAAEWGPYAPPAFATRLALDPGAHELVVGDQALQITVVAPVEKDQAIALGYLRSHTGAEDGPRDCSACHAVEERDGLTVTGPPDTPDRCLVCHSSVDFGLAHFHPLSPLKKCEQCHALHGSARKGLLRAPKKELCSACHDS
jgi:predicted CXXCH cytochrome family protein